MGAGKGEAQQMQKKQGEPAGMPGVPQMTAEEKRKLEALGASADGQKVRALLGDEDRLRNAIETGDASALKSAMETVLRSEEGKRLLGQLGAFMGKP